MSAISLHHYVQIEDPPVFEKVQPPSFPIDLVIHILKYGLFYPYLNKEIRQIYNYKEKEDRLQNLIQENQIFQILFPGVTDFRLDVACKKIARLSKLVFKATDLPANDLDKVSDWIISPDRFAHQLNIVAREIAFKKPPSFRPVLSSSLATLLFLAIEGISIYTIDQANNMHSPEQQRVYGKDFLQKMDRFFLYFGYVLLVGSAAGNCFSIGSLITKTPTIQKLFDWKYINQELNNNLMLIRWHLQENLRDPNLPPTT